MNDETRDAARTALETRSHRLFHDSVDGVDMALRSRLTQARYAALDAAAAAQRRPWFLRLAVWTPAVGAAAAALVGVTLWLGGPFGSRGTAGVQSNLEVLDMVASSDGASGDAIEMLQDDIDFYDFTEKAANSEPSA